MDKMTSGARDTVRGCLVAAGTFLFLVFFLRFSHLGLGGLELFLLPPVLGFGTGVLIGSRWKRPIFASLLLGAALVVAATIPYTIDTVGMAHESGETYANAARGHP